MILSCDALTHLSEEQLLAHFDRLVVRDRGNTAQLLIAIAEIDERKLWASHGCSSMFRFCMKQFHMSEQVTAKRLWAARTARRFPAILDMVACGEIHLTAIQLLAKHLTPGNHEELLRRAAHKSSREIEQLIAEVAPKPDVPSRIRALPRKPIGGGGGGGGGGKSQDQAATEAANGTALPGNGSPGSLSPGSMAPGSLSPGSPSPSSPSRSNPPPSHRSLTPPSRENPSQETRPSEATFPGAESPETASREPEPPATPAARPSPRKAGKAITPLSPRRYKIEITVGEETYDKLRSLQDLLVRHDGCHDPATIVSRAIDVLLVETLKRKAAFTDRPRTTTPPAKNPPTNGARRSRHIPAAVRREVWRRDCGRCRFIDHRQRRCGETRDVEFHHKVPFGKGGDHGPNNLELRCRAHNQHQADLDFGHNFMRAKRNAAVHERRVDG